MATVTLSEVMKPRTENDWLRLYDLCEAWKNRVDAELARYLAKRRAA